MLSIRASEEEIARIKELAARLMLKHPYLKEADVIRELIGLVDTGLITPQMRKSLIGASTIKDSEVAEKLFKGKPAVTPVDKN